VIATLIVAAMSIAVGAVCGWWAGFVRGLEQGRAAQREESAMLARLRAFHNVALAAGMLSGLGDRELDALETIPLREWESWLRRGGYGTLANELRAAEKLAPDLHRGAP